MASLAEQASTLEGIADLKSLDHRNYSEHVESSGDLTWTADEEKKLVRKVDLMLLPTIWIMYLLSYMDRTK
jgi:hypothetical protein